jgi:hypothetical protein
MLFVGHFLNISFEKPAGDQRHYLAFAYNSLKHGVFDDARTDRPRPDNRREPLYPAVLMLSILVHPQIDVSESSADCITGGEDGCLEKISYLKMGNVVFLIASALLAGYVVFRLTGSAIPSVVCYLAVALSGSLGGSANRFLSEMLAALLIVAVSMLLRDLIQSDFSRRRALAFGVCLGLLVLTKAQSYYLVFLCALFLLAWWLVAGEGIKQSALRVLFVLVGVFVLVLPWQIRNYKEVGTAWIAGRSGLVLTIRANYNEMSAEEYRASFLLFMPRAAWPDWVIDRYAGTEIEERLLGQDSYFADGYARHREVREKLGFRNPKLDAFLRHEAVQRILANFGDHLLMVAPFAVRGSFAEVGYGFNPKGERYGTIGQDLFGITVSNFYVDTPFWPNVILTGVFLISAVVALVARRWAYLGFLLPGLYWFGMHAFLTNFTPRFSIVLIPIFLICTCVASWNVVSFARNLFARNLMGR